MVLIFLGESIVNSYLLRSTPAIININTALQWNQSCSNFNVNLLRWKWIRWMGGSAQNGVKKSGHLGLSQSQFSTCSLLLWVRKLFNVPLVSSGGGTPPVGQIVMTLPARRLWALEERGSVKMGVCILGAHALPCVLRGAQPGAV